MNYENLVQAGKTCITKLEGAEVVVGKHRLTLGRLALEACGAPTQGRPSKNAELGTFSMEQFATDIGFPRQTLNDYRKVAHQWAGVADAEQYSWAVLTLIADADDKDTILANTLERFGRVTVDTLREYTGRRTSHDAKLEQARAEATAAAEAKAAEEKILWEAQVAATAALAGAAAQRQLEAAIVAEQKKAEKAAEKAIKDAERKQAVAVKAERDRVSAEEKAKAEAAAAEKLKHIEELLRAQIAAEPPTPEVLAEMAKQAFSSDDPNIVQKMVDAYGEHVATRLANEIRTKRERAIEAARNKAENAANKAVKRASLEYDDSALRLFNEVYDDAYEAHLLLSRKMVTFSNLVASGFTMGELLARCTSMVNFATEMKTAIENAGAEGLIDEAMADVSLDEN